MCQPDFCNLYSFRAFCTLTLFFTSAAFVLGTGTRGAANPDPFAATVTKVVRQVEWQRSSTTVWQRAALNNLLLAGDGLRTGAGSHAELLYGDGSVTRMGSLTSLVLTGDRRREVRLTAGKIWLQIRKGGAGMRVLTPGAVATVTGTELMVEFDPARRATEVTVFEGSVDVTGDVGNLVRVLAGTTTRVPLQAPAAAPVPLAPTKLQERSSLFKPLSVEDSHSAPVPVGTGGSEGQQEPAPDATLTRPGRADAPEAQSPVADADPLPPPPPGAESAAANGSGAKPDLKGQTDKLLDPRVINGSPTTGAVRVIIE